MREREAISILMVVIGLEGKRAKISTDNNKRFLKEFCTSV